VRWSACGCDTLTVAVWSEPTPAGWHCYMVVCALLHGGVLAPTPSIAAVISDGVLPIRAMLRG
jgi:hypothetical protein